MSVAKNLTDLSSPSQYRCFAPSAVNQSAIANRKSKIEMAEGVRFELTRPFGLPVFKTGAINRSATPPENGDQDALAV